MAATQKGELQEAREGLARVKGLLGRWCGLTGNAPDVLKGETAINKFREHLASIQPKQKETTDETGTYRFD